MSYLEWSDRFSVKIRELDDQHKRLISMINTLHDALRANKGREAQRQTVHEMIDYAEHHFSTEEFYMQKFNYAGYLVHKIEHKRFTEKAAELKERIDGAGFVLTIEVLEFLKSWLQDHILVTDMKYSGTFRNNGLL